MNRFRRLAGMEVEAIRGSIAVAEIDGAVVELNDNETGKVYLLDGEYGVARTENGNIKVPTYEKREDDEDPLFRGVLVLGEGDSIPKTLDIER